MAHVVRVTARSASQCLLFEVLEKLK